MTWIHETFGQPVKGSHVLVILLGGYFIGCLTTGYYLVRLRLNRDIRDEGSGSVGARNVGRLLGMPGFLITLAGDFAKGVLAVSATLYFTHDTRLAALAMLAVVMGHIWPVQLTFRGGKGVATSLGALAVYDFRLALVFVALFAGLYCLAHRTTLCGLLAFTFLPLPAMFMDPGPFKAIAVSFLAAMILAAHHRNLAQEFSLLVHRRDVEPKPNESLK